MAHSLWKIFGTRVKFVSYGKTSYFGNESKEDFKTLALSKGSKPFSAKLRIWEISTSEGKISATRALGARTQKLCTAFLSLKKLMQRSRIETSSKRRSLNEANSRRGIG